MPCPTCHAPDRVARYGRRDVFAWTLIAALGLLAALAAPCLVGYVYTYDDLGAFHLPMRAFYAEQLSRGEPFDWNPQLFCGFYLTGEGQAGTYHPLHWVLYRLLPLGAAWSCELLAGYAMMLAGTYLLVARLVGRRDAALFGGLAFTFSGFNLLHLVHPNAIAVIAHTPWLLWLVAQVLEGTDRRRVAAAQAGIALLTGSQLLLGHPQFVWFSLLAEAAYAACLLAAKHEAARRSAGKLGRIAIAKLCGVMLGGVQLLPTLDALSHSVRHSVDGSFVDYGSLHPLNLVQLVAPYLFTHRVAGQNTHELGLYVGAVPLVLLAWLFARRREWSAMRGPILATAGLGIFALILALGKYGPFYRFQRLLPVVGRFRFPCRYTLLVGLCVAVLAAVAVGMLARRTQGDRRTSQRGGAPVWGVVAASLAAAIVGLAMRDRACIGPVPGVLAGPLLIGAAAALLGLAARGHRWALAGLVLFAAADLGVYGLSYAAWPHAERLEDYAARAVAPAPQPDGRVACAPDLLDRSGLRAGNEITLAGWRRADGYAALEPAARPVSGQAPLPALRAAGVRWVRRTEANDRIAGLVPHDDAWLQVPRPLPRVRLATPTATRVKATGDDARPPRESSPPIDEPRELPPSPPGTARVLEERPGHFQIRVECPTRQLLVVAERYHAGWRAEVDGRAQPVVRVDGTFLGCVVGPGRQQVVLDFRPESLWWGWATSLAGLLAVCGCAVAGLLPRGGERPGSGDVEKSSRR